MRILFFKARAATTDDRDCSVGKEPLPDKIQRILVSHVQEANTDEDRERAERELRKLNRSTP